MLDFIEQGVKLLHGIRITSVAILLTVGEEKIHIAAQQASIDSTVNDSVLQCLASPACCDQQRSQRAKRLYDIEITSIALLHTVG